MSLIFSRLYSSKSNQINQLISLSIRSIVYYDHYGNRKSIEFLTKKGGYTDKNYDPLLPLAQDKPRSFFDYIKFLWRTKTGINKDNQYSGKQSVVDDIIIERCFFYGKQNSLTPPTDTDISSQNNKNNDNTQDEKEEKTLAEITRENNYNEVNRQTLNLFNWAYQLLSDQNALPPDNLELYSLNVAPSLIPEADDGVFVKGFIPQGRVILFYPGLLYQGQEHKKYYTEYMNKTSGIYFNDYTQPIITGELIDATHWIPPDECLLHTDHFTQHQFKKLTTKVIDKYYDSPQDMDNDDDKLGHLLGTRLNPFALAHKINHVPKDNIHIFPNVIFYPIYYPYFDYPLHLRGFIPCRYRNALPVRYHYNDTTVPGLCVITLRDVVDEELYIDYRMFPPEWPNFRPSWYRDVANDRTPTYLHHKEFHDIYFDKSILRHDNYIASLYAHLQGIYYPYNRNL